MAIKTVFTQGAFDIINACHAKVFVLHKDCKIIIALNSDDLIRDYKKREPIIPYSQRKIILLGMKNINKVVSCDTHSCIKLLKKYKPDIFTLGKEWLKKCPAEKKIEIDFVKSYGGKVVYTPSYKKYLHSTNIRRRIKYDKSI